MTVLQAGQPAPLFTLPDPAGQLVRRGAYRGRAALLILFLPPAEAASAPYLAALEHEAAAWGREQVALVISASGLERQSAHYRLLVDADSAVRLRYLGGPELGGWFITDRYGELYAQGQAAAVADLPAPAAFGEWLQFVGMRCGGGCEQELS